MVPSDAVVTYVGKSMKRLSIFVVGFIAVIALGYAAPPSYASNYSSGSYGTCTYDNCSISLSTSGSVSIDVTPVTSSITCTVSKDNVTATTDSSTGYTITLQDSDTSTTLAGPSASSIAPIGATPSQPAALTANTWGYRIDGIDGFGSGPTSTTSNSPVPNVTFASVPSSNTAAATVRSTTSTDSNSVTTPVWYGLCANTNVQSGSYTDSVTYTALVNN